jgi:hypothetical protein
MKYKNMKVEEVEDKNVDKAGEEEVKQIRRVKLVSDDVEITIRGTPEMVTGFVPGDMIEVQGKTSQTKLEDVADKLIEE